MPDYFAILTLYQLHASASVTGRVDEVDAELAASALDRVAESFLSPTERAGWESLAPTVRTARRRLGRQRLRRWELANPDISAVLKRKARSTVMG